MLNVLFFASVREHLGMERLACECEADVEALIAALVRNHGKLWEEVLTAPNIIVAVNHEVVARTQALRNGDEVAFFPPVTGG